jgi:hypothetical protein
LAAAELGVPLALPLTAASFAPAMVSVESPIHGEMKREAEAGAEAERAVKFSSRMAASGLMVKLPNLRCGGRSAMQLRSESCA